METYHLEDKSKIKLWKLLYKMNICYTKEEAETLILLGEVRVNDMTEFEPETNIHFGDLVEVDQQIIEIA